MALIDDIAILLGEEQYSTIQGSPDDPMDIQYVNGPIASFSEVTDTLSLPADFEDAEIELLSGSTVSLYGFDSDLTLVYLLHQPYLNEEVPELIWCHCFKYANSTDYETGKTLQTPDISMRV